jgi:predicted DNA-binding ribbon-helix-helix protein
MQKSAVSYNRFQSSETLIKKSQSSEFNEHNENLKELGKSTLVSRNITVLGRRTSVRLEPEMWAALKDISKREKCSSHDICSLIQIRKNVNTSLTAAIRVFLMLYYRASATEEGHKKAGHGNFREMMQRAKIEMIGGRDTKKSTSSQSIFANSLRREEQFQKDKNGLSDQSQDCFTFAV